MCRCRRWRWRGTHNMWMLPTRLKSVGTYYAYSVFHLAPIMGQGGLTPYNKHFPEITIMLIKTICVAFVVKNVLINSFFLSKVSHLNFLNIINIKRGLLYLWVCPSFYVFSLADSFSNTFMANYLATICGFLSFVKN